jgi:hypothetical protein
MRVLKRAAGAGLVLVSGLLIGWFEYNELVLFPPWWPRGVKALALLALCAAPGYFGQFWLRGRPMPFDEWANPGGGGRST